MVRPLRIQYPGAVYHVMARGSHGQEIFADDADRKRFLETLGEACQMAGWCPCLRFDGQSLPYHLELPKGSPEKLVLAWWLREDTTVTLR